MFMRFADAEMGGHMSVFGPGLYKNGRHLGPSQFRGKGETAQDRADRQIEYPDEDPWIRETFEAELAKRGAKRPHGARGLPGPRLPVGLRRRLELDHGHWQGAGAARVGDLE